MPRAPPMHIFQVALGNRAIRLSLIGKLNERSGSRQGHICIPHPLIITESNKRETAEVGAKETTIWCEEQCETE